MDSKLYLSGPITDPDPVQQRINMERFFDLAYGLRHEGWVVVNPAELETDGWSWEQYLARDLLWISENRPTMYMMHGWQASRGARLEREFAKLLGLTLKEEP